VRDAGQNRRNWGTLDAMKRLPLPVRVATGLAVTAVEQVRHLPERLVELPVTVVSQLLQLSMRVQHQMTELAIKGDDALAMFRSVEDTAEWARFDEEDASDSDHAVQGSSTASAPPRSRFDAVDSGDDATPEPDSKAPGTLPGYYEMSLPQLRARLRWLSADELQELIDYERTHDDRPEFVGMLTRRIAAMRVQP